MSRNEKGILSPEVKKEKKFNYGIIIFILLLVAFVFVAVDNMNDKQELKELSFIREQVNFLDKSDLDFYIKAEELYEDASYYYELRNFDETIRKCENAREYYWDYTYELRKVKAELENYKKQSSLIGLYKELVAENIIIGESMYEACEYFETAALNYKHSDYQSGDANIESMNEKIRKHDQAIRRYNDIEAQIDIYIEDKLEEFS